MVRSFETLAELIKFYSLATLYRRHLCYSRSVHDGCGTPKMTRTVSRAMRSSSSVGIAYASNCLLILRRVEAKSCPLHPRTNSCTNVRRIFSDAACENNCVSSAHRSQICADVFPRPITENFNTQTDPTVFMLFQLSLQFAHVIREPRNAEQAGLRVEQPVHLEG